MSTANDTVFAPGSQLIADGFDWSWAFVAFREVPGWPGYMADSFGRIWSSWTSGPGGNRTRWHALSPQKNTRGYHHVKLRREGAKALTRRVPRIILESFFWECPPDMEACHNNGNKDDNSLSNLRWDTKSANQMDSHKHGTATIGSRHHNSKLNEKSAREIKILLSEGRSPTEIAKIYKVSPATIADIKAGRSWTHVVADVRKGVA